MSSNKEVDTVPFWKKIYQTISGYSTAVDNKIVDDILKMSKDEIIKGFAIYSPYTQQSFDAWKTTSAKFGVDFQNFFNRLSKSLNLQPDVAFSVFSNYLMFEYFGKVKEIKGLTLFEHSSSALIDKIWHFYTADRMFYIKILRHIFDSVKTPNSQFREEYTRFIESLKVPQFRESLIKQFEGLIKEITDATIQYTFNKKLWVTRNNREQLEFLLLIITTSEYTPFTPNELKNLLNLFLVHNFTRQPMYFDSRLLGDESDFFDIKCAEIGCFLIAVRHIGHHVIGLPSKIESELKDIQTQGDHSIVLFALAFSKLKYFLEDDDDVRCRKYESIIKVLLGRNLFDSFVSFLNCEIFETNLEASKLILSSTYFMVNEFVKTFKDKDMLYANGSFISIVERFLRDPTLAEQSHFRQGGIDVIIQMSFDSTTFDFTIFTKISKALVQHSSLIDKVIFKLNHLGKFVEDVNLSTSLSNVNLARSEEESKSELSQTRSYREYSYFSFLENMTEALIKGSNTDNELATRAYEGFDLISQIVKNYKGGNIQGLGFSKALKMLHLLIMKLDENPLKYPNLINMFFVIHARMILYQKSTLLKEFPLNLPTRQFLPKLMVQNICLEVFFRNNCVNSSFYQALRQEESSKSHNVLITYLEFLKHFVERKEYTKEIQIPGLIYIMNVVFSMHLTWEYKKLYEKTYITTSCLKIFQSILLKEKEYEKADRILFQYVKYCLLSDSQIIDTFFQILLRNNVSLHTIMQKEMNWLSGKSTMEITIVRIQLGTLLYLMKSCEFHSKNTLKAKLPLIVKSMVMFIMSAYDSSVANLACRMLEKLAKDADMPVLALLEMDHAQVRSLFLEKLRDPLEDDQLKITILDLINTSLTSQHGLTAAFFNVPKRKNEPTTQVSGDTVSDFMIDYLQNIHKGEKYLENPVQRNILKVFATLWETGREHLVREIYSLKKFWPLLADPLFHTYNKGVDVYTYILNIITLHIAGDIKNVDANLREVLENFLGDEKIVIKWVKYIAFVAGDFSNEGKIEKNVKFLVAWQKFLIIVKRYVPSVFKKEQIKCCLIRSCLECILSHFSILTDNRVINIFSDLYLILIFAWPSSVNEDIMIIEILNTVLTTFSSRCGIITLHTREVFLTMIHKTILEMRELLEYHCQALDKLLKSVGIMMDSEFEDLDRKKLVHEPRSFMCWILVARIGDSILSLKSVRPHSWFFTYYKYINRMIRSLELIIGNPRTFPMAKMIMETLITYAECDIAIDFIFNDSLVEIYDVINPTLPVVSRKAKETLPLQMREQWVLYGMVIKLNHILLKKFGSKMLETNLTFLSVQDKALAEMISLPEHTVDGKALDLVCEALYYVDTLFKWLHSWSGKYLHSFEMIIDAIKKTINACISTILRPENIIFYNLDRSGYLSAMDEVPNNVMVVVIDKLIEILCLATNCLNRCNPNISEFLDPRKPNVPLYILLEHDFSVPKFDVRITEYLTYGRLLCIVHFFCKTLIQAQPKNNTKKQPSQDPKKQHTTSILSRMKNKTMIEIFNELISSDTYTGFIEFPQDSCHLPQPKLSAFLHYGYSGVTSTWVHDINRPRVQLALEYLMTFLACQVFFHIRTLEKSNVQYFKRELESEVQFFQEYVRKIASEEYNNINNQMKHQIYKGETDLLNKLMVVKLQKLKLDVGDLVETNFLLAISKWFTNICEL